MEKLFTESFFSKNDYFKNRLKISNDELQTIKKSIINWQKQCETFVKGIDKETTDSGPFIKVVFENILGYHDKGKNAENFTLISEFAIEGAGQGNSTGFSDLALGYFKKDQSKFSGDAQVLVEFKDQSSNDLEKPSQRKDKLSPVNQCWNYLNSYNKAKWGIVTNYNEIRLYNKNIGTTRYEVFYFVVPDELKDKIHPLSDENEILKFIAILHIDNLISISGISNSEDILNSQGIEENQIQNSFYKEYKILREKTFNTLLKINHDKYSDDKGTLLGLVQTFLDRIIFCWFCEDSREQLLPSNILSTEIIENAIKSKYYNTEGFNIWADVKELFSAINVGGNFNINQGFNGGLFEDNFQLNELKIPNKIFEEVSIIGREYDFGNNNEVNVNILGHIFEQSIADLEEMRASFEGDELDKSKSKRKKDGIYYTPEFVTSYIVENTIGAWLDNKYKEVEVKHAQRKKGKQKAILTEFRDEYLSKIRILDPACGSGAFLLAAFNYLWAKHQRVYNELKILKLKDGEFYQWDEVEKTILENNLFGVDINPESVEITKLSLWLKTASKNKKLNNLDKNIKCGNSLIDDEKIAGKKAFSWEKQFGNHGFDIIIGNPPYVGEKGNSGIFDQIKSDKLFSKYYRRRSNLYYFFIIKSIELLDENGYTSLIVPQEFLSADWANLLRGYIKNNIHIIEFFDFGKFNIFADANTSSLIFIFSKVKSKSKYFHVKKINPDIGTITNINSNIYTTEKFEKSIIDHDTIWRFDNSKVNINTILLGNYFSVSQGLVTGCDKVKPSHVSNNLISETLIDRGILILKKNIDIKNDGNKIFIKINSNWLEVPQNEHKFLKKYISSIHLKNWYIDDTDEYIIYIGENTLSEQSIIYKYLEQFQSVLINRCRKNKDKIISFNEFIAFSKDEVKENYIEAGAVLKIMKDKNWFKPLYERIDVPFDSDCIIVNTKNMNTFSYSSGGVYSSGGGLGGQNFIYPNNTLNEEYYNIIKTKTTIQDFVIYTNSLLNSSYINKYISLGNFNQLSTDKISNLPFIPINFDDSQDLCFYNEVLKKSKFIITSYHSLISNIKNVHSFLQVEYQLNELSSVSSDNFDSNKIFKDITDHKKLQLDIKSDLLNYLKKEEAIFNTLKHDIAITREQLDDIISTKYN